MSNTSITSIKKVIKIGTSKGIALPAKELKALGIDVNDHIKITFEKLPKTTNSDTLPSEYKKFVKQYHKALKDLADR